MAGVNLENQHTRLTFDAERGGRLAQTWYDDTPLLVEFSDEVHPLFGWGSYPMVPWAGRLAAGRFQFRRDVVTMPITFGAHAMHGVGMNHAWEVVASGASSLVARLDLKDAGWPFAAWAEQRISLGPEAIHMEISVHSSEREFPAQVGWHPWFLPPEHLDVDFATMFVRDEEGLTTTSTCNPPPPTWDDCFTDTRANPRIVVNGVTVELSSSCKYWVVYNKDPRGVCIEPQSGIPNAFNSFDESGLDIVGPGRVLQHSFTWSLAL